MPQVKTALVLSGGGIKAAAFHMGVALALKEKNYRFIGGDPYRVRFGFPNATEKDIRMYIGSSAGAFVTSLLANGYSPEAIINAFSKGSGHWNFLKDDGSAFALPAIRYRNIFKPNPIKWMRSLPAVVRSDRPAFGTIEAFFKNHIKLNGFFSTEAIENYLRYEALVIDQFKELGVELYIIATQLNHTRKAIFGPFEQSHKTADTKYISYASISEAVAASIAIPPFFSPKRIKRPDGKEIAFFDGEIRDTLSSYLAQEFGAQHIIASYSVHPYHYTNKIGSLDQFGLPVIMNQALYQMIQQKIARTIRQKQQLRQIYRQLQHQFSQLPLEPNQKQDLMQKTKDLFKVEANYQDETKWTYIHPQPQDDEMFFADHFSLNIKTLERLVGIGYRAALFEI